MQNQGGGAVPPPLPQQTQYFYALNGQQTGPISLQRLTELFKQKQITGETLIWKQGMGSWTALNATPEYKQMEGTIPPPLPQA